MSARNLSTAAAAAVLLTACATGPDYKAPVAPPGTGGGFVSTAVAPVSADQPPADWWRLYQDPALDGLIAEALDNNRDVAVAAANLAQVRASLSEARAGRLPGTTMSAAAARSRQPDATGRMVEADTLSTGLDVSYEVDFFGRVGRSIEAARAERDAARAALDVVRVSVAAETARAYADACAAGAQLAVAQRTLALSDETAGLTRRQMEAGRGTGLDLSRAQAQAETARAAIPPLQAQRDAALFRLSVLVGRPPAQVSPEAAACQAIPQITAALPVGDGAALLARRPDVRQAERRLAAATARIGVAAAALYPQVTLGGSVGSVGGGGRGFGDQVSFSVGPLISWSFPNIAVARARIAQADAATQAALATFEQTTLTALQEAETALSAYGRELDRRTALRRARDQSAEAVRLARLRHAAGLDSFLTVLDAERTLAGLEAQLALSEAAVTSNQIRLFKALGGGWERRAL
ncbi:MULTISPECIES: efflux transporter outer membrane subunit [unclassified Phenylobacterium]|uniref:efflux transporter outer membrane subunit n=1 Tax=unclassified Phenylobacterium TaxID=2640670 RepID=UPI00215105F4|nr:MULTISPECIES: efflux transporter outer membrane subunit [unclassified Phenylobacterium]MCR5875867.1 efflux transporter outer membrane subunit [Phenylobacterium sp. J426]MCR5880253.1 efflux transporter outer membrane subunit [Phenylobacterium sp. J367]